MNTGDRNLGIAAAFIAGITWGFLGLFVRGLNDHGISSVQITCLRYIVVSVVLGLFLLLFYRNKLHIDKRTVAIILIIGILGTAMNSMCYMGSMARISLSLSTVLQYLAPFIVVIASVPLFGERMTVVKGVSVVIAFMGCVLCTGVISDPGSLDLIGFALGAISGLFFAIYTLGSKDLSRHSVSPITLMFYTSLVCCLVLMPFSDIPDVVSKTASDPELILLIVGIGLLMTLLPFGLYNYAVGKIEVGMASIITYVEPMAATVVGFIFYSEAVSLESVIGIVAILFAVMLINRGSSAGSEKD